MTRKLRQVPTSPSVAVQLYLGGDLGKHLTVVGDNGSITNVDASTLNVCNTNAGPPVEPVPSSASGGPTECLEGFTLRTTKGSVLVKAQIGAPLIGELSASTFELDGDGKIDSVKRSGSLKNGQVYDVLVRLPANGGAVKVGIPAGALKPLGIDNMASNTLQFVQDKKSPVPVISTPLQHLVTNTPVIPFLVDFGEPVLAPSADSPFPIRASITNATHTADVVLDATHGTLSLVVYINDYSQPSEVTVWVDEGVLYDLVGNKNSVSAKLTVKYVPSEPRVVSSGKIANAVLGGGMAACLGASWMRSWMRPFAPGALACGLVPLVGQAQLIYLTGQMSAQWLPQNFVQVATTFSWTLGQISIPWASTYDNQIEYLKDGRSFPLSPAGKAMTVTTRNGELVGLDFANLTVGSAASSFAITGSWKPVSEGGSVGFATLPSLDVEPRRDVQTLDVGDYKPPKKNASPLPPPPPPPPPPPRSVPSPRKAPRPPAPSPKCTPRLAKLGKCRLPPPPRTPPPPPCNTIDCKRGVDEQSSAPAPGPSGLLNGNDIALIDLDLNSRRLLQEGEDNLSMVMVHGDQAYIITSFPVNDTREALLEGQSILERLEAVVGVTQVNARTSLYDILARATFWSAVLLAGVFVLHASVLALLMWKNYKILDQAWFPRAELTAALCVLPAITFGASVLFKGSKAGDIVLALVLLFLLPLSFLFGCAYLLRRWLSMPKLPSRKAIFVQCLDPTKVVASGRKSRSVLGRITYFSIRFLRSMCGACSDEGAWIPINLDSRFVLKYGTLFDATQGQVVVRKAPSYEYDPFRSKVHRGSLVPVPEKPLYQVGALTMEKHTVRIYAQLASTFRLFLIACIIGASMHTGDNMSQAAVCFVILASHIVCLWFIRPYSSAVVGAIEILSSMASGATCVCAIIVISKGTGGSDAGWSEEIGRVMIGFQLGGLYASLLLSMCTSVYSAGVSLSLTSYSRKVFRMNASSEDRLVNAIRGVIASNESILLKKYVDRWLVRARGVGLHARPVWRRETEDLKAVLTSGLQSFARCGGNKESQELPVSVVRPRTGTKSARPRTPTHVASGVKVAPFCIKNDGDLPTTSQPTQ